MSRTTSLNHMNMGLQVVLPSDRILPFPLRGCGISDLGTIQIMIP